MEMTAYKICSGFQILCPLLQSICTSSL